jgi:hypothetical protein
VRFTSWLLSFGFTLLVEVPVGAWRLGDLPRRRVLAALVAATSSTHPLLWWVLPRMFDDYWTFVVVGEVAVVLVESVVLRLLVPASTRDALSASLWANGASYLAGILLRSAGVWPGWRGT